MSTQETSWELPRFSLTFRVFEKGYPDQIFTYEGDMPEQLQDQFRRIIGDGLARVSVGVPLDLKDFGSGGGAHVSVSLTCNQDANSIHQAHELAMQAALYYVKADLGKALAEFDQISAQRKAQQGMLPPGSGPQYG